MAITERTSETILVNKQATMAWKNGAQCSLKNTETSTELAKEIGKSQEINGIM